MSTKITVADLDGKIKGRYLGPFSYSMNSMLIMSSYKFLICPLITNPSGGAPSAAGWNKLLAHRFFAALFLTRQPFSFGSLV
jgi:hypothetical protein